MKVKIMEMKPKERKRVKWYWWLIVIVISMMFGVGMKQDKIVIKEVPVTKTVVQECDYSNWKALKDKDDQIISLAGQGFIIVSETFDAISRLDVNTIDKKTAELETLSNQIQKLAPERQTILHQLGY